MKFGDAQIHIEWSAPDKVENSGQGRGNSGLFLQNRYELQILDSYNNRSYSNGQAGSIYKDAPLFIRKLCVLYKRPFVLLRNIFVFATTVFAR